MASWKSAPARVLDPTPMLMRWFQCRKAARQKGGVRRRVPLWAKISYTAMAGVVVTVYWFKLGPKNYLWFSDIALITLVPAIWWENRLLTSMMALAVLLPELAWNVDFFATLVTGQDFIGLAAYMFNPQKPLWLRGLSLFHVVLPVTLLGLLNRLGYDRRALPAQTLLAWIVLPATYLLTGPERNINWVYGPGEEPQQWLPTKVYLLLEMVFFPVCIYLPMHFLLGRLFGRGAPERARGEGAR